MKTQRLDWSDIPYILAVCEIGTLSGAARSLGVNHSTVFRRVEAVEEKLGVRLFHRQSHGYVLTSAGEYFHQKAKLLSEEMSQIELELGGRDLRLEGRLTITTTDSLLHCLTPEFAAFQSRYPDIELRLLSDIRPLDLMQRDADIALRPTRNPPEHWVGRRLSSIPCAAYAEVEYWEKVKDCRPDEHRWVLLDDLDQSPMSKLARKKMSSDNKMTHVNSVMGAFDFIRSGLGIGVLPCYLGDHQPKFVRIDEPDHGEGWDLWLLTHPDVRRSARVHAFFEFAKSEITEHTLIRSQ